MHRRTIALALSLLSVAPTALSAAAPAYAEMPTGDAIAREVANHVGRPYVWGGETPDGFDCSGLVMYVYRRFGVRLPHSAAALYGYGRPVSVDQLQPGDLIFQANTYKAGISHVGIYVGGGQMVHAQNSQVGVVQTPIPRFPAGVRRILSGGGSFNPRWSPYQAPTESPMEVEGTVVRVMAEEGVAELKVAAVTDAAGKTTPLAEPRTKLLVLAGRVPGVELLAVGAQIRASGSDTGPGTPLRVKRIVRRDERSEPIPPAPEPEPAPQTPDPAPPVGDPEPEPTPAPAPAPAPRRPAPRPTRPAVIADFEGGWNGWSVSGNAFAMQPTGPFFGAGRFTGWVGGGYLSTARAPFANAPYDAARGKAVSPAFTVTGDTIQFRIAGGRHEGECCLNLVVDGEIVRTATGDNTDELKEASWDVSDLQGKAATLEVVDTRSVGLRGYILVDRIEWGQ